MTYRPPASRMRLIKRDAPAPVRNHIQPPRNVEEALVQAAVTPPPEAVFVVEEVAQPVMEEVVPPLRAVTAKPDPEVAVKPEPKAKVEIQFNPQMKKSVLLAIAVGAGLAVDETMTKNQIISTLQDANV